jgi:hypothetical protein
MADETRIPASVVIAKRNAEGLDAIGVSRDLVFRTIKKAMIAFRPQREVRTGEGGRVKKRDPDWNTRLRAVELYLELTSITPAAAVKTMQGATIEVEANSEFHSRARERGELEQMRRAVAGESVMELPSLEDAPLRMPTKKETLNEVIARREREQQEREEVEAVPRAQRFKPSVPLSLEDVS